MNNLPELQARLARLNADIHSGEKAVTADDGSSVTYRSLQEMKEARRDLQAQIAAHASAAGPRLVVMRAKFGTLRGG